MSIKTGVEGTILGKVLTNLAASEPITTFLGALLAAIVALKINYSELLAGDPNQIASLISGIVIALLGYYTNNKNLVKQ